MAQGWAIHVIPEIFLKIKRNEKKVSVLSWSHSRAFCYVTDAIDQIKFFTTSRKIKNIVLNIGNTKRK